MFVCMYMWFRIVISGLVQIRYMYMYLEENLEWDGVLMGGGGRIGGSIFIFNKSCFQCFT